MKNTGLHHMMEPIRKVGVYPLPNKNKDKYLVLPAFVSVLIIGVIPILFQLYISLNEYYMGFPWKNRKFVGFDNYLKLFNSPSFKSSFKTTILFTVVVTVVSLVLGLLIALLLNRDFKFKSVVITSILIPQTISPSILGLLWKLMYNSEYGVINYFLKPFSLEQVWLGKDLAFLSVVFTSIWMATSFMALISLAGVQNLPVEVYEAAQLDGANKLKSFFHITLPLLKPVIGIAVLLQQVACLHIFGIIYTMTGGGPGQRTNVLALEVYRQGLNSGFVGYGAGAATILALLALVISLLFIKIMGDEF